MKNYLIILLAAFVFGGCASSINNIQFMKGVGLSNKLLRDSKIAYINAGNITVKEHKSSFEKAYPTKEKLDNLIFTYFGQELESKRLPVKLNKQNLQIPEALYDEPALNNLDLKKNEDFWAKVNAEYALLIKGVELSSFSNKHSLNLIPLGYHVEGVNPNNPGSLLKINFEVWNVKEKRRLVKMSSFGAESMDKEPDEETLNALLKKTVSSAAYYLATDTNDYRPIKPTGDIIESIRPLGEDFNKLKKEKIAITLPVKFSLEEFKVTFKDEYPDTLKFYDTVYTALKKEFKKYAPQADLVTTNIKVPQEMLNKTPYDEAGAAGIKKFLSGVKSNYLIVVKNVYIGNKYNYYSNFLTRNLVPPMIPGQNNIIISGKIEFCVVNYDFDCWDVANKKKIMSATVYGQDKVILFAFQNAMDEAIKKATETFGAYLAGKDPVDD